MAMAMLVAGPAMAQSKKAEVKVFVGYTFSEGVPVNPQVLLGETYNRLNPKSGSSYGFGVDVFTTAASQIGFQYSRQKSTLQGEGSTKTDFLDMNVDNYHAIFTYNIYTNSDAFRPFVFGGLGATNYSVGDIMGQSVDGATRFSTTWGAGVKLAPASPVGLDLTARWTPTYINSSNEGIWCSPYWGFGCYQLTSANFSNQFSLSAGVNFRF
jgi:opacity protein-like surface antigen